MPEAGNFVVSIVHPDSNEKFEELKEKRTDKSTECYIESKSGEPFKIVMNWLAADNNQYGGLVYVDGGFIIGKLLGDIGGSQRSKCSCEGVYLPNGKLAPFMFGETQFTEEGSTDGGLLAGLVHHRIAHTHRAQLNDTPVNEKAKKALLTHSVKLAAPITYEHPQTWSTTYLDSRDAPQHTFTFLYRSRTILEALDILPPIPIPEDEREEDFKSDDDEDEGDQKLDLDERIRHLKFQLRELKKRVKQEPDSTPAEVIDLTGEREVKRRKVVLDLT